MIKLPASPLSRLAGTGVDVSGGHRGTPTRSASLTRLERFTKHKLSMDRKNGVMRPQQGLHHVPNLQSYVSPSKRMQRDSVATMDRPLRRTTNSRPASAFTRGSLPHSSSTRALLAELGHSRTKVNFRSDQLSATISLMEACSTSPAMSDSKTPLSVSTINRCMDSLEHLGRSSAFDPVTASKLLAATRLLRRCVFSDSHVGPHGAAGAALSSVPYMEVARSLEVQNSHMEQEIESLKQQIKNKDQDRSALQGMLTTSHSKNTELREKIQDLENANLGLKRQLHNMRSISSDMLEENGTVTDKLITLDKQHFALRQQHKTVCKELSDLKELYSSVSNELSHAIRNCGRLETELREARTQAKESAQQLATLVNLKSQFEQLKIQHETVVSQLQNAEEELQAMRRRTQKKTLHRLSGNLALSKVMGLAAK